MRRRLIALLDRVIHWGNSRLDPSSNAGVHSAEISHETTISAVVTRADGSVEDLGTIANGQVSDTDLQQIKKEL